MIHLYRIHRRRTGHKKIRLVLVGIAIESTHVKYTVLARMLKVDTNVQLQVAVA